MEGLETVSSGADLSASFTPALDSPAVTEAAGTPDPVSPDAEGISDSEIDALNDQGTEGEATEDPSPDNTVNEEAAEEEQPDPVVEAQQQDPLPDGVKRGKDRNGKEGLWVTPERWASIYDGSHKTMKAIEGIAGQPVTPEMFETYSNAFWGQERLYSDILSGDPISQEKVLVHFLDEGARARDAGEIGADPIIPLARTFYSTIKGSLNPDGTVKTPGHAQAYAALRMQAAKDLIAEMYDEATASGSQALWDSAGHFAKALGQAYRKSAEFEPAAARAADPLAVANKRIQELEQQQSGRTANDQAAQFDTWKVNHSKQVSASLLNEAIMPALSETQKAWEKLPGGKEAFQDLVVNRLHSKVRDTLLNDLRFNDRIELLDKNARRAPSAQMRATIGDQIKQAHIHRANQAIEAHLPDIEKFANLAFKEQNAATHQRRTVAATRVAPGGGGSQVKKSLVPAMADFEMGTPGNLAASLNGLFR